MFIEVTPREAARILARGGHVWDSNDAWACCIVELVRPPRNTRQLRALTRKMRRWDWDDGLYIYKKDS